MRKAGILMPVASLPSKHGIGDFGYTSYTFISLLKKSGMKIWQILPLNPLGYGNSPYQPYSSHAMDELYISLDLLKEEKLIKNVADFNKDAEIIDYDAVRSFKHSYLKEAFDNFKPNPEYQSFIQMDWVYKYAVFLTLKKANELKCWVDWDHSFKDWIKGNDLDLTPYQKDIEYEMFIQYVLYAQWLKVKAFANQQGIEVMGDIPIYVGIDSDDVWTNQKNFLLDEDGRPTFIAGVPPDYFSATGQRWGNPLYNWEVLKEDGFTFWLERLSYNNKLFNIIRIDHFRAFDTYWKIPSSCETAIEGQWVEAPGYALFDEVFKHYPNMQIVAEDLGDLRQEVLVLRDHYQFKGMRIVQFSFDPTYMEEDRENLVIYTGTHDNQTINGWYQTFKPEQKKQTKAYFKKHGFKKPSVIDNFIDYTLASKASLAIIPLFDVLKLNDQARLNTPGTVGNPNWQWKIKDYVGFKKAVKKLHKAVLKYNR